MNHPTSELDHRYRTLLIIWLILLLSQLMFIGVVFAVKRELFTIDPSQPLLGDSPVITLVFAVLAVTNLAFSFLMRKRSYDQAVAEQKVEHIQTGLIIACALCESISILGVVLAFAFSYPYFYFWIALGIIGIFLNFPRRQHLLDASFRGGNLN